VSAACPVGNHGAGAAPILGMWQGKDQHGIPMRTWQRSVRLRQVRSVQHARVILELEIDCDSDPIAGVVRCGSDAQGEVFVGWMGLTRAIELALEPGNRGVSSPPAAGTTRARNRR
jgi:hypothetical protein